MIDTKNAKWELSEHERYAIWWFDANGYEGSLEKQYLSKTKFKVSKYGVIAFLKLPVWGITDIEAYMQDYDKMFQRFVELAHGVNAFGENQSLSTEDYEEFLQLFAKLCGHSI